MTLRKASPAARPVAHLEAPPTVLRVSDVTQSDQGDRAVFVFTVIPTQLGAKEPVVVRYGDGRADQRHAVPVAVTMPAFFDEKGQSYLEMVAAPDESVYGAHVTVRRGEGRWVATGHAASSVCRAVSGALFNVALRQDEYGDGFFLGAGLGVVSARSSEGVLKGLVADLAPHTNDLFDLSVLLGSYQNKYARASSDLTNGEPTRIAKRRPSPGPAGGGDRTL
ncbi:MAG: hypothetical protein ACYDA8_16995 [Deferrisomatales bacterium]